ncbi:hypothetical protein B0H11DRAFT_15947 [Mycena galericulata]|nr:hypothetical protein B0H11DRAFT_15947 [Mycena galericulata]
MEKRPETPPNSARHSTGAAQTSLEIRALPSSSIVIGVEDGSAMFKFQDIDWEAFESTKIEWQARPSRLMNPTESSPSLKTARQRDIQTSSGVKENIYFSPRREKPSARLVDVERRKPLQAICAPLAEGTRSPKPPISSSSESSSRLTKCARHSIPRQLHSPPTVEHLTPPSGPSSELASPSASTSGLASMAQYWAQEKEKIPHKGSTADSRVNLVADLTHKRRRSRSIDSTDGATQRIYRPSPQPKHSLSPEQSNVLSAFETGHSVQVVGLPGVGKTETAIAVFIKYRGNGGSALFFTRTRERRKTVQKLLREATGSEKYNADVHFPFSLKGIKRTKHALVILDDCQDYTVEIYSNILPFIGPRTRVAAFGTPHTMSEFLGADTRFLTLASQLFGAHRSWNKFELTVNFGANCNNTKFLNEMLLSPGDPKIKVGDRPGPLPTYLYGHIWDAADLAATVKSLMLDSNFHPGDCVIVVPSLKNLAGKPLSGFLNELTKLHVPVMRPNTDNSRWDPSEAEGKVVALTYHRFIMQGLRPKFTLILGVDASYFQYYGQGEPPDRCPSTILYVVLRTSDKVVLVQDHKFAPLFDGESWVTLPKYADLVKINEKARIPPCRVPTVSHFTCPVNTTVSKLLENRTTGFLEGIKSKYEVDVKEVYVGGMEGRAPIKPRTLICTDSGKQLYEGVGDLNGLIPTAAFEHGILGTLTTLDANAADYPSTKSFEEQAEWLARTAIRYNADRSGFEQRAVALENVSCDWMNDDLAEACERLEKLRASVLPGDLKFEVELDHKVTVNGYTTKVIGRADIVTEHPRSLAEVKCAFKLYPKDELQLIVYGVLLASKTGSPVLPRMFLFNITDGKCFEIHVPGGLYAAKQLLADLVEKHICPDGGNKTSDEEFITKFKIVE